MDSNNFFDLVHQGFRTAVGAAASVVETFQNPQKREETFSNLNSQWQKSTQEWAEKGETTEKEARRVVEEFLHKQGANQGNGATKSTEGEIKSNNVTDSPSPKPDVATEIRELTAAIVSLITELEPQEQSRN
jgi:polyhydroxyalkanoate synthesis regulator phasin